MSIGQTSRKQSVASSVGAGAQTQGVRFAQDTKSQPQSRSHSVEKKNKSVVEMKRSQSQLGTKSIQELRRGTTATMCTQSPSASCTIEASLNLGPYRLQAASKPLLDHCRARAETAAIQICQAQNCAPNEIQRQLGLTQQGFSAMTGRVQDPNAVNELFSTYPILQMIYLQAPDIFSSWNPYLNKHANETWNAQLAPASASRSGLMNSTEIRGRFSFR